MRSFPILPYVAEGEVLEPQVSNYEPRSALYAGPTGLEIYQRLIPQARKRLKPDGWLMLEIGFGQQAAVKALLGMGLERAQLGTRPAGNTKSDSGTKVLGSYNGDRRSPWAP